MRTINPSHPHAPTTRPTARRSPHTEGTSARRLRPQLIADAVLASYIHEISARHSEARANALSPAATRGRSLHPGENPRSL